MTKTDTNNQVVVIEYEQHKVGLQVGLLVGELHSVAQFNDSQINNTPLTNDRNNNLIKQIIKANDGALLIQDIDISFLIKMLSNLFEITTEDKKVA